MINEIVWTFPTQLYVARDLKITFPTRPPITAPKARSSEVARSIALTSRRLVHRDTNDIVKTVVDESIPIVASG